MKIKLENNNYEVIKNYKDGFKEEEVINRYTDYFEGFDYLFGDWAYNKLRLKGFYDSKNKLATKINDIKYLDDYIKNFCAYDCRYFLLKKDCKKEK